MPAVKITKTAAAESLYWQEAPVFASGDYTFSAYVKAENLTGGGAFARLKVGNASYESIPVTGSTSVIWLAARICSRSREVVPPQMPSTSWVSA